MSTRDKIVEAALAGDVAAVEAAVAEHRRQEAEHAAAWGAMRAEVEGKDFYCYPRRERRTVRNLVTVNGHPLLGRSYEIVDTEGDRWEIAPVTPEANDGMPFSVMDPSQREWADRQLTRIADYEASRRDMPVPTPRLRDPSDTAIVYQFSRFHVPGEREVDSLEDALQQAEYDVDYNEAAPMWVTQGDKVLKEF